MPRPRILDEAAEELADAAARLEADRPGYARKLLEAYEEKLRQVSDFPESGSTIQNVPAGTKFQSFRLRRFRYAIIVGEIDGEVWVVAVAHTSRRPGYWKDRLK